MGGGVEGEDSRKNGTEASQRIPYTEPAEDARESASQRETHWILRKKCVSNGVDDRTSHSQLFAPVALRTRNRKRELVAIQALRHVRHGCASRVEELLFLTAQCTAHMMARQQQQHYFAHVTKIQHILLDMMNVHVPNFEKNQKKKDQIEKIPRNEGKGGTPRFLAFSLSSFFYKTEESETDF